MVILYKKVKLLFILFSTYFVIYTNLLTYLGDAQLVSSQDEDQNNSQSSNELHLEIHPDDENDEKNQDQDIQQKEGESTSTDVDDLTVESQEDIHDDLNEEEIIGDQDNIQPESINDLFLTEKNFIYLFFFFFNIKLYSF